MTAHDSVGVYGPSFAVQLRVVTGRGERTLEKADFDLVIINEADNRQVRMTKEEYFRLALRVRVNHLCNGQVRFFHEGKPVSTLKALKSDQ
jgi:late competence protein required for DNA uptake (superfamily II DNA/RNA helicase)